ncbi:MAG: hypothetical protein J6I46_06470 [Ruminococcus sp.]|nr:hypothetical protein [Ruminococcus sp.]MBP3797399.1 hypothetical protein [Ruminococcus sp.]
MDSKSVCWIFCVNLKHNFLPHLLLALLITFLTPIIFGISSLNERESAQPLEMLLSLTGTVLLTPIFMPEQNENIRDLIRSKKIDYLAVCFIRLLYSVFFLAIIFVGFTLVINYSESEITLRHLIGGYSSALFLGALGFFFAGISKNSIIGYMVSMIYYISNFTMKDELKNWYLFSMSAGSFQKKYWLIGSSVALFAITFLWLKLMKK